jgi:hypothetical protein
VLRSKYHGRKSLSRRKISQNIFDVGSYSSCKIAAGGVKAQQAPIFGGVGYGIVDDFQNMIPILREKGVK